MDQMAAVGDNDLITWRKYATNPVIINGPENPLTHGTDCAVFKHETKWYMLLGGFQRIGEEYKGAGSLHVSDDLIEWRFAGVPLVTETRGWEEPDLFKIDGKWVLTVEPFGPSQYFVGSFDFDTYKFTPQYRGYAGATEYDAKKHDMSHFTGHYIVCCSFVDGKERRICFGIGPKGLAIPRVVELNPDGRLLQSPAPEIQQLRRDHFERVNLHVNDESVRLGAIDSDLRGPSKD